MFLTFRQYYRYLIAIRKPKSLLLHKNLDDQDVYLVENSNYYEWEKDSKDLSDFNPLRLGKKLYHQYLVDAYVKVEQDRLDILEVTKLN